MITLVARAGTSSKLTKVKSITPSINKFKSHLYSCLMQIREKLRAKAFIPVKNIGIEIRNAPIAATRMCEVFFKNSNVLQKNVKKPSDLRKDQQNKV